MGLETGGSSTLVHLEGLDTGSKGVFGGGFGETETQRSFLPPVEEGWMRAPDRSQEREAVESRQEQHPYTFASASRSMPHLPTMSMATSTAMGRQRQAIVQGEREKEDANAQTLALLRGEACPPPSSLLLSPPPFLSSPSYDSRPKEKGTERDGKGLERRPSQATSAAGSIPSSFRAAVMGRFASIANAPFEMEALGPRAI